jgi:hypothetical protein
VKVYKANIVVKTGVDTVQCFSDGRTDVADKQHTDMSTMNYSVSAHLRWFGHVRMGMTGTPK